MKHFVRRAVVCLSVGLALVALFALVLQEWTGRARSTADLSHSMPPAEITDDILPSTVTSSTVVSSDTQPLVWVNLSSQDVAQARLRFDGPVQIRQSEGGRAFLKVDHPAHITVTLTDGKWECGIRSPQAATAIAETSQSLGDGESIEFAPAISPAVWFRQHQYRGRLRLLKRAPNAQRFAVINVVPLEEYVASVIDSEMPSTFPDEARKAQAIAARTYVMHRREMLRPQQQFDVYASTRSQRYLGAQYVSADGRRLAGESERSRRLARQTAGLVCKQEGELFTTYYSAVCGGHTAAGAELFPDAHPSLAGVECSYCQEARNYRWSRGFTRSQTHKTVQSILRQRGDAPTASSMQQWMIRKIAPPSPFDSARLPRFELTRGDRRLTVNGLELRTAFGVQRLPSPRFLVTMTDAGITIAGRGSGHGVGLCQWGARGMAIAGYSAEEILRYYYPGCQVEPLGRLMNRQNAEDLRDH